ncbi:MAG: hypothetical protein KBC92_11315 [Giesbergeria sp.]|nr:hypothetical protein [Giesbergeria sp.]MBP6159202.1 hypothetical protein [Giesbergeria sp.]MBP7084295.1 hypothetical protein [Giesbergeria sp.]MBP9785010.1 hypothetical protein [Giesbergeria sp.]
MTPLRTFVRPTVLAASLCLLGLAASAQTDKAPKTQLWIDLSTGSMAGMPELDMPMGGGLMGMVGGGRPGMGSNTHYGMARTMGIMPPRVIDIALHNSLRPGVEARQAIPPGMRMGESLPLLPPKAQPTAPSEPGELPQEYEQQKPKGRILVYWGCGSEVRAGQPRVIDLARAKPTDFAVAFAGRAVPDQGARVGPSHALYPNERNQVQLARDSSLVGEHQVIGEGVPASMRFTLGSAQDLMPAIDLRTTGKPQDSMGTTWQPVRNARAYYLHGMSQNGDDMVMWSSAETPDTGMGLFDYLPNATIDRWLKERVLLPAEATQCAIPRGIFAAGAGRESTPMLRMMAYGGESHIVHPPRPADPKAPWAPEWAVRVRVKAHTMAMLGEEQGGSAMRGAGSSDLPEPAEREEGRAAQPANTVSPINLLRGILGR